ncbi:MAG: DUF3015 family protein [Deltaproteobacteria bacterium]|nr:DUF3015 family protein [Deltaproteobacteria bacterium]
MKKTHLCMSLAFAALTLSLTGTPAEAAKYGMAGCGLGSIIFASGQDADKAINDQRVKQVLAATTNGTFGTQTFGITTGTSNCTSGGTARNEEAEQMMFAEANFKQIARDMANGGGEYVTAFSALLGCSGSQDFASVAQKQYETIFPAAGTTPAGMLMTVKATVASDPGLAQTCTRI